MNKLHPKCENVLTTSEKYIGTLFLFPMIIYHWNVYGIICLFTSSPDLKNPERDWALHFGYWTTHFEILLW